MSRTVFLHIGLQKTGTSYLQGVLTRSRVALAAQGLDLVPQRRQAAFWLMLDVRDRLQAQDPPQAAHVLDRLPGLLADAPGDRALISEESLSPADDAQIARLLGALDDREVHLVVTCRDLARQIPSVWQQGLQSGRRSSLTRYLRRLRESEGTTDSIWWQKDLPGVLERWSRHVPADRIHVVTVPPPGSGPEMLLERYCRVLGVDPATLEHAEVGRSNRGLRLEQAEVMRRINLAVPTELKRRDAFGKVGKRFLAVEILGGAEGRQVRVPAQHAPWCQAVSQRYADVLRTGGYDVVGDPDDLVPDDTAYADGDQVVSDAELAHAALAALTEIVTRQLRAEIAGPAEPEPALEPLPEPVLAPESARSGRWRRRRG